MALITTKSGDTGMTQLNPDRIASKTHPVIEIMGTIDELSCALGIAGDQFDDIQTFLSELMGYFYYKNVDERRVAAHLWDLENYITGHNNSIPPHFINPRGYVSLARAICRRAERLIVAMAENDRVCEPSEKYGMNFSPVLQYMNRLSDYLFVKSFERTMDQPELFQDEMTPEVRRMAI